MNKKIIIAVIAFIALVGLLAGIYFATAGKPTDTAGTSCSFTVTVVHADASEKTFTYTAEGKLGAFLEAEGLIDSQGADPGMFHTVDGEKADWNENQSYWAFYLGDAYAMTGIYDTDIVDGALYKLVYTIG